MKACISVLSVDNKVNNVMAFLNICLFLIIGASDQTFVFQTPPSIIKKPGESVDGEIHCSHNASDSDHLLWYKQDKHQAPKCLGYLNRNMPHPEEDVEDRINFAGESSDYSNLTISAVSVNDSAVYFCAVSQHSMEESA
uniref:Ig-like domain-containing protein n=1 Tax=Kryptolebias marmoratus TaxID=37003 RepID=A0A3Q3AYG0_KRYMA